MTKIYRDADLWDAVCQRRRILGGFLAATALYIAAVIVFIVFYVSLPYEDPAGTWLIVGTSLVTAVYLFFSFPYMGISYKRCNAYVKMLKFISVGLKEYSCLPFMGIEDWTTHDGVDVNVATFAVRNIKRDEEMTRQIFVDGEKDFPDFEEGQKAKLVSQGNLLIEYQLQSED